MVHPDIEFPKDKISEFCQRNHIKKLALFGSVLRDDFNVDSDIDVLVEFEDGHLPGLIRLSELNLELSELLNGRAVDMRTPEELSRYFRDDVVANAEVQYAAG
jgi:hypothetical protein